MATSPSPCSRPGAGRASAATTPSRSSSVNGRPLIAWALDAATGTGFDPIVVVTGYKRHEVGKVVSERFDGFKGITVVHNRHWKQGIASSLHAALDFVDPFTRVGAVCVGLADQPRVGSEAYRRLASAYADGADLVVATYDGQRANPGAAGA